MTGKDCMDKDFLFALLQAAGASSDEHRPSALFRQYLSACADEVVADPSALSGWGGTLPLFQRERLCAQPAIC